VVGQILRGETLPQKHGFAYGYAYEAICWVIGSTLCHVENHFDHPHEEIDEFLETSRIPLRLRDLSETGSILEIPEPGDYPFMGWWTPEQIGRAIGPLRELSLDEVDETMADDARKVLAWLEEAVERGGDCLVGFQIG
jgi:hypothetical protein